MSVAVWKVVDGFGEEYGRFPYKEQAQALALAAKLTLDQHGRAYVVVPGREGPPSNPPDRTLRDGTRVLGSLVLPPVERAPARHQELNPGYVVYCGACGRALFDRTKRPCRECLVQEADV